MSVKTNINKITVLAAGVTKTITGTDPYEEYVVVGSATLAGNVVINTAGTPPSPCKIRVMYKATLTTGAFSVSIFSNTLNNQQALSGNIIVDAIWDGTAWYSWIVDTFVALNYEGFRTVAVNLAGATVTITSDDKQVQYFTGSGVLAGNYSVTFSGTFREGQTFYLKVAATLTIGASALTFFGENINATTAAGGNYAIIAWYDLANTTFRTQLIAAPASAAGYNAPSDLAVPAIGINYPAASAGDTFRLVCASEEGRIGAIGTVLPYPEPPLCKRVQNNQMMYCVTNTAGGNEAAAGTAFWILDFPNVMMPMDTTNATGSSNYRVNSPGHPSQANIVGAGTNVGNGFWGFLNSISGSSIYNWLVGSGHSLIGAISNLAVGSGQSFAAGASRNIGTGSTNSYNGNNNLGGGQSNATVGTDSLIVGFDNEIAGLTADTSMRSLVAGAGAKADITNGLYLGSSASASSYGGAGAQQLMLFPLSGAISTVAHPALSTLSLAVTQGPATQDTLLLGFNSMAWQFEARVIVAQTAIGVTHTNTSAIGDWAEYIVAGVVKRNSAGTTTLTRVKWLDHRNRWVPLETPNAIVYRNRETTGARPDVNLIIPSIGITANILTITFQFPGFAEAMTDQGANTSPRFASYVAAGDVNGGAAVPINTPAATDGVIPNTITTTLAPLTVTTYRYPVVDIFDGNDTAGSGYYGGNGFGATATALTKATSVAGVSIYTNGSYDNGVTATITFSAGNATGVCVMSANTDHIGNNVGFTAGDYTGVTAGNYPFTFAGGTGSGAAGFATIAGGVVTGTTITNGGSGYTTGDIVTLTIPTALPVTTPAVFTPTLYLRVTSVTIGGVNNNYTSATNLGVTFAGAGIAQAVGDAYITPTQIDGAGTITIVSGGKNYGVSPVQIAVYDRGGIGYHNGNGGSFRASGNILISQIKYS